MAVVRLLAQDGTGRVVQSYTVVGDDAVIGRAEGVGIHIEDPSVSRQHARIVRGPNGFEILELSATNGVLIAGRRVARHVLRSGERFRLGNLDFVFEVDDPRQAGTVMVGQQRPAAAPVQPMASPQAVAPTPQAVAPTPQAATPTPQAVTPTPQAVAPASQPATPTPQDVAPRSQPAGGRRWGLAALIVLAGTAGSAAWLYGSGWVGDYFPASAAAGDTAP